MDLNRVMNLVFLIAISHCLCYSVGSQFSVGNGWVIRPSEEYSHWSCGNKFLVNDTLLFKYNKEEDSVLLVAEDDYYNCNTSNWFFKNENGSFEFKLTRSGPFFFISGVEDHCKNGQKLLLEVLSEKHHHIPAVPPSISPVASPPTATKGPFPTPVSSPPEVSFAPAMAPSIAPFPTSIASPPEVWPAPAIAPSIPPVTKEPFPTPASSPPIVTPAPAISVLAPESPSEDVPKVPVQGASQKAAASTMNSGLPILTCSMIFSYLFLRAAVMCM